MANLGYTSRIINGSLRYRATGNLQSALKMLFQESEQTGLPSLRTKLRQHPFYLSLPALALPAQLDLAAISYLREHSLSSPKAIEDRSVALSNYLWSRPLMDERRIVRRKVETSKDDLKIVGDEELDSDLADLLQYYSEDQLMQTRAGARRKCEREALEEWRSLTYSGHTCELYLTARLAPNFASACRILYEIRKRCPRFIPRNLFDFGSGLGTATWAVNTVWPVGCVQEHYLVEPSADMTRISEYMLRKDVNLTSSEDVFPGIFHRRFFAPSKTEYDIVMSGHSLLELPGRRSRLEVVRSLWGRTSNFLVLIEQGTKAGFSAILEARDWLVENGGKDCFIFSPCPHTKTCGKKESICNTIVRYYHFGLTREKVEPMNELISYLVVCRGDWRRFQSPVAAPEDDFLPRLVSHHTGSGATVTHDVCLPSGHVERVVFPKGTTDKSLYFFLRHAKPYDIVPCERFSDEGEEASPQSIDADRGAEEETP